MRKILSTIIAVAAISSPALATDRSQMPKCNSIAPTDWDAAKKICDAHTNHLGVTGPDGERMIYFLETKFEDIFTKPCNAVDAHFNEKERQENLNRKVQAAKDLNQLNDFLAGSAAK